MNRIAADIVNAAIATTCLPSTRRPSGRPGRPVVVSN
jgi:hypothetical protein